MCTPWGVRSQMGHRSCLGLSVRQVSPEPAALMIYLSQLPSELSCYPDQFDVVDAPPVRYRVHRSVEAHCGAV